MKDKTKAALFRALIWSIMLYNAEVWPVKQQDLKAIRGANNRMIRSMAGLEYDQHACEKQLQKRFGLPDIADFITQKRLRWVGHALRRKESDSSFTAVAKTLKNMDSPWTKLIISDCEKKGIDFGNLYTLASNRAEFSKITFHSFVREKEQSGVLARRRRLFKTATSTQDGRRPPKT